MSVLCHNEPPVDSSQVAARTLQASQWPRYQA